MNDLKTTSVLQKLYKNSTREGQVSLVSTHDVTNPPVHYCNWSLVYFVSKMLKILTNSSSVVGPYINMLVSSANNINSIDDSVQLIMSLT